MIIGLERLGSKMSVSILEVLENAGYDVKNNLADANWLLAQQDEWGELIENAEHLDEIYCGYEDFIEAQEDLGNFDNPTFEEWKKGVEYGNE